jgi:hypothetical protein
MTADDRPPIIKLSAVIEERQQAMMVVATAVATTAELRVAAGTNRAAAANVVDGF